MPLLKEHPPGTKQSVNVIGDHTVPFTEIQLQKKHELKWEDINQLQSDDEQQGLKRYCYQEYKTEKAITQHQPSIELENMRELQELCDAALCKICLTDKTSVHLMPCKHISTCAKCSISLQQCPVCEAKIKEKIIMRDD